MMEMLFASETSGFINHLTRMFVRETFIDLCMFCESKCVRPRNFNSEVTQA